MAMQFLKKFLLPKTLLKSSKPPRARIPKKHTTIGRAYDLVSLYSRLNHLYFDGKLEIEIRWSARQPPKARRKVLLGSYHPKKKRITMSRRLDSESVPLFFVEHVLFHEMLHSVFPSERHSMHTERFRKFEKMHPDYERARDWEKSNIKILFSAAKAEDQLKLFGI